MFIVAAFGQAPLHILVILSMPSKGQLQIWISIAQLIYSHHFIAEIISNVNDTFVYSSLLVATC